MTGEPSCWPRVGPAPDSGWLPRSRLAKKTVNHAGTGERPRELRWYHAGPMLFGDWGTSRLYVLGLAFAFNGRASFWFIALMSVLLVGVGWSYEIICRLFPDGGGVYSSARHRSQILAVIGGLLLCADYVVTASLSCLDAFHYLEGRGSQFRGIHGAGGADRGGHSGGVDPGESTGMNYFWAGQEQGTIAMWIFLAIDSPDPGHRRPRRPAPDRS